MSRNEMKSGRTSWRVLLGALALASALPLAAQAQQTVYWRNGAGVANWWDGANPWYRSCDGWWIARPDYNTCGEASTIGANIVHFDNGSDLTMNINGAYFQVHQLLFDNGTGARTMTADGSGGIDMRTGSSTVKIENNDADAQVLNTPVVLYATTEINPVSGNLTFARTIYLKSNWINVYGANQKYLYLNGQLNADSGNGGLSVKQDSIVVLTNDNTFAGAIWVEKGTVQLNNSTNAMGASGIVNVGTNATLDLQYGAAGLRPFALNLYGTGTNVAWGALRKTTSGSTTLRGILTLGADSKVVSTAGGMSWATNVAAGSYTLYLSNNTAAVNMTGGEMTGSKTTGDGALHKSGNNTFLLRPGSGLTGSILLTQGEIRHGAGSDLPSGGTLILSDATTYRSDGGTARTVAKASQINGNVTLGYSGGGTLTFSGNVDLTAGQRTLTAANDIAISGAITNGGLTKAGAGTMVLSGANTYALGTLVSAGTLEGTTTSLQGNITNNSAVVINQGGAGTYAGVLSGTGTLTKQGAGVVTLSGNNLYSGVTTISAGAVKMTHANALGTTAGNTTVASGAALEIAGTITSAAEPLSLSGTGISSGGALRNTLNDNTFAGALTLAAASRINSDSGTLTLTGGASGAFGLTFGGAGNLTVNSVIGNVSSITKDGAGTLTLPSGPTHTISGTATISAGTLINNATAGGLAVSVSAGATNIGAGTQGATTVSGMVSPGSSSTAIGTLAAGNLTLNGEGSYFWHLGDASGVTDRDLITCGSGSGTVTINATSGSKFTIYLEDASLSNFDTGTERSWTIIDAGTMTTFAANKFAVDATTYWSASLGGGAFSLSESSGDLVLTFTPGYAAPTVSTPTKASIGSTTATLGATIADNGGQAVTDYGVVWATATGPTLADNKVQAGTDDHSGAFTTGATGLPAGTLIYYRGYATNAQGAGYSVEDSFYTLSTEPAAQVANFSCDLYAGTTATRLDLGWDEVATADGYLILRSETADPTGVPADGSGYSASDVLGNGVVAALITSGSQTAWTNTGLTADTRYYYKIYPFGYDASHAATYNYKTDGTPGADDTWTIGAAPGGTPTLSVVTTNQTSATITWVKGASSDYTILVMSSNSATITDPAVRTGYAANAGYGLGDTTGANDYTVYAGSGTNVTVTGLVPGTVYYFELAAYNGTTYPRYSATVAGSLTTDRPPGIGVGAGLVQTATLGTNPGNQTFVVTNIGGGLLSYVVSTNAGWLSVSPTTGTNKVAGGTETHTVTYNVAGLYAGGSNATITVTGTGAGENAATNSPRTISVQLTLSLPPNPTAASATADGKTMVRLAWTTNSTYPNVMIVYKAGSASTAPTQGASYSVGGGCGGGVVIFKGGGTNLEHVVASDATNHYAFYTYNGNYYSAGLADSAATTPFAAGEVVETFSYTNSTALTGLAGSNGWGGAWYGDTGDYTLSSGSFSPQAEYPTPTGNKAWVTPPSDTGKAVFRPLGQEYKNGRIYFGYMMNYQYGGANKYEGLSLMWSNTDEKVFFGEIGGQDQQLGIDSTGSSYTLTAGGGNDYIIVGYYDWSAGEAKAKAFKIGTTNNVPTVEPTSWDVTVSKASNVVGWVNTIRLASGAGASSGTPGDTYFDEVRVATNWAGIVLADSTVPALPAGTNASVNLGQYFAVEAGGQFIDPASGSGTTNVHYRIPDNVFGEVGDAGRSGNLQNPGFDGSADGWRLTTGNNIAEWSLPAGGLAGGSAGGLLFNAWDNSAGAFGEYLQDVAATSGAQVVFSALMRQDVSFAADDFFGLWMQFIDTGDNVIGGTTYASGTDVNTTTQRISVVATAPAGTDRVRVLIRMTGPPGPGNSSLLNSAFDGASGTDINGWTRQSDIGSIAWGDANAGANAGGTGAGIKFDAYTAAGSGGFYQDVDCQEDDAVTFQARMQQNGTFATTFFGTRIQFLDSGDNVLETYNSSATTDPVTTESRIIPVSATAPAGTVKVRCVIRMEGSPGGSDLFGYADDASLSGASGGEGNLSRFGYVDNCQLAGAGEDGTGTATLGLFLTGYDLESGLSRDTTDADTQSNVDVTNAVAQWKANDVAAYDASRSSVFAATKTASSTSTWYWTLGAADFEKLLTDNYDNTNNGALYGADGRVLATNRVTVSLANAVGGTGRGWLVDQQYGYLSIQDDDVQGPSPTLIYVGTNVVGDWGTFNEESRKITITDEEMLGGGVDFAYSWYDPSGVFVTNANGATNAFEILGGLKANVCPNYDLTNATYGSLGYDHLHVPAELFGANGDQVVTARVVNLTIPGIAKTNIPLHEAWTLTASAQDYDFDRGSFTDLAAAGLTDPNVSQDRGIAINVPMTFSIQDDDTEGPVFGTATTSLTDDEITDKDLRTGGWTLSVSVQDVLSGLSRGNGTATDQDGDFSPYLSFYSPVAYPVLLNEVFGNYADIASDGSSGKSSALHLTNTVPVVPYDNVVLGVYTAKASIADYDDDRYSVDGVPIDRAFTQNAEVGTFTVIDDDSVAPSISITAISGSGSKDYATTGGEILFYDFGTDPAAPSLQPARTFLAVASVADVAANGAAPGGQTGNLGAAAVTATHWNDSTNYWELAVAMLPGFQLDMQKIRFDSYSSLTGPTAWALRSSADGYVGDLASGALANNASWQTISANPGSSPATDMVTYRLYGSGASSAAGAWRLDNLSFTGAVSVVGGAYIATDSDLKTNGLGLVASVQDAVSGIFAITAAAGKKPVYSLKSPVGVAETKDFTVGPASDGGAKTPTVLAGTNGFTDIVLGTYTAVVTVVDADDDRPADSLINSVTNAFSVVDDDAAPPKFSTTYRKFDGQSAGSESTAVTDGMLVDGLSLSNRVYDVRSGLLSASNQFRIQDPLGWDSGRVTFAVKPGDGGAKTSAFDAATTTVATNNYDVQLNAGAGRALGVWTCSFYAVDFDADRPDDALATTQAVAMYVIDDDKLGPRMTNLAAQGASTPIASGFETIDGWASTITEGNWTTNVNDGTWIGTGMYIQSLNGRGPEGTTAGNNAGFNTVDDSLQLPAMDQPGWLVLWAKLSGAGESKMELQRKIGEDAWESLGTNAVTATSYAEFSWTVDSTNAGEVLRLRMAEFTTGTRSIYFDDVVVAPYRPWTNAPLELAWAASTDEFTGNSGISGYRLVPFGSNAPLFATNGLSVGTALGTNVAATKEIQGVVTSYVFAADADEDRGEKDRTPGLAVPIIARLDIVPPTAVPVLQAATETVDDPTTQFDMEWTSTGVGPDDSGDLHYPSWGSGNSILSPWKSYKIYYGTFDPLAVPPGDPGPGNGNAYIYTNFIATGAYSNWPAVSATNAIADPSAAGTNYLALTNFSQGSIRLYDLDYDQDYAIIVVGLDKAGNEGPANPASWVTNNTIKFAVTQGLLRARAQIEAAFPANNNLRDGDKGAGALYWLAATNSGAQVTKEYDLIYYDTNSFQENSNWVWKKVGTVQSNWFTDAPGQDLARGKVRFYRASYKDRWPRTNVVTGLPQRPLASEEVYALHNVVLSEGFNYVGLHGVPYTNTFLGVFGADTNLWPAGQSAAAGATKVEFYAASSVAEASATYYFATNGQWYLSGNPTPVTTNLQAPELFSRGFSITLPKPLPANYVTTNAWDNDNATNLLAMVWHPILQVPTNGFTHVISAGVIDRGGVSVRIFNLVSLNLPVSVGPAQLNLPTNFVRGDVTVADEISTWDTANKATRNDSSIYCNAANQWRFVTGDGPVPAGYFKPNDVIVIISRHGGLGTTWEWSYHPTNYYNLPTRWMGQ